jgi:hypothetical protein
MAKDDIGFMRTDELIEQLRAVTSTDHAAEALCHYASDEIVRLQAEIERLHVLHRTPWRHEEALKEGKPC